MPKKRQRTERGEQAGWGGGEDAPLTMMAGQREAGRKGQGPGRRRKTIADDRGARAKSRPEMQPNPIPREDAEEERHGIRGRTLDFARGVAGGARDIVGGAARGTQSTVSGVTGYVRDHRWPAMLIGAGATWMAVEAMRGRGDAGDEMKPRRAGKESRRQSASNGVAKRTISAVADAGRGARRRVRRLVRANPLTAGAATLGLGVAVGMALPSTMTENQALGEARDRLVRKAKDVARSTAENVKDAAESVTRLSGR